MTLRIEVASASSFCPGVERAVRMTEEVLSRGGGRVYSLGPLIHNPAVVENLRSRGLEVLEGAPGPGLEGSTVVIRSHGADTATEEALAAAGARLVDATCPTVKRAQDAARELVAEGRVLVVVGSAEHPEVAAVAGRVRGPVAVVADAGEAKKWALSQEAPRSGVGVIAQTTVPAGRLASVAEALAGLLRDVRAVDTTCDAVERRRLEAVRLSGEVDLMVVVGGRNSNNTRTLAEACGSAGVETRLVEDPAQIDAGWLEGISAVGVTGGASTPGWLIEDTVRRLEELAPDGPA